MNLYSANRCSHPQQAGGISRGAHFINRAQTANHRFRIFSRETFSRSHTMGLKNIANKLLPAIAIAILSATTASAELPSLASRNYTTIKLVAYPVPSDCAKNIKSDAIVEHMNAYIAEKAAPFISFDTANELPHLAVKTDCLKLEDTRGEGRIVGYTFSVILQFYRPFYEDITYIHASTWSDSDLLYIPTSGDVTQEDFNEMLDPLLDRFANMWLDEHKSILDTDSLR